MTKLASLLALAALLVGACVDGDSEVDSDGPTPVARTCDEATGGPSALPDGFRPKGKPLSGDVDGDGTQERISLQVDPKRPESCRYLLLVETASANEMTALIEPLDWPGTDPHLRLLAQVDGRPGVEQVVAMNSRAAVYRPGVVFTVARGELEALRLPGKYGHLFPFYDEFPAGVDCAGEPGTIVVTWGDLADGGTDDSHWDITRIFYRATGALFEAFRHEEHRVEVGPEAQARWPEIRGDPFLSCPNRIA